MHMGYFAYEVTFGISPIIIHFMRSTLWYTAYYFGEEDKFPITKGQLGCWIRFQNHFLFVK